ncbi:MAG TPA: hypothetical protein PKM25_14725 [Candidatus Ozemobacteraceae bacterium]|nr:hypothetical protein [Candidatus Ozemobacteraceae bacterium]
MFYLSLIILSIAMGAQFYKNKPKTVPKQPKRPAASVNLDDLDLRPSGENASDTSDGENASAPEVLASGTPGEIASAPGDLASGTEVPSAEAGATSPAALEDPVLFGFANLSRSPFEPSPFSKMIELAQASAAASIAADPLKASKTKTTEVLSAPFGGTIETQDALVAIIDRKLYRLGEVYMGKTIRKIEKTHVTLDDHEKIYLLPKVGVRISISSDTVSVVDDFMKHNGQ